MPITPHAIEAVVRTALQAATEHRRAARLAEAEAVCMQVFEVAPGYPDALHLLGLVASDRSHVSLALSLIDRAIEANPLVAAYHAGRGDVLRRCGMPQEAAASLRRAIELDARLAQAHNDLGLALLTMGQAPEAVGCFERAVAADETMTDAQFNLGRSLRIAGDTERATRHLERAAALDPCHVQTQFELACVAESSDDPARCAAYCNRALELKPDFAGASLLLGNARLEQGDYPGAAAAYRRAMEIDPRLPQARYQLALSLLRDNDFAQGWPLFEARYDAAFAGAVRAPLLPMPMWRGEDIPGGSLLVLTEQSYGDHIQFCRLVAQLAARDVRTFVCASPSLIDLMQSLRGCTAVVRNLEEAWDAGCDYWTFVGSLPCHLHVNADGIPADTPYLAADPQRVAAWHSRLEPFRDRFKVGLFWADRTSHVHDRNRSLTLEQLAPLAQVPGVAFFGLQQDERAQEAPPPGMTFTHCGDALHDFSDTAALLTELDLLITVDSAPAHLAGALRRPVWTLLPFRADWRWQTERTDTPWYPGMRLFRQPQPRDWRSVIDQVREALLALTAS